MIRSILFLFILITFSCVPNSSLIIFSYNRPLQLYALLESVQKYVTGIDHLIVIYRASNKAYQEAYATIPAEFSYVTFLEQTNAPADFKQLTLQGIRHFCDDYLIFAVDDIVVKDYVNIKDAIALMEVHNAYGFYLRLGKHLSYAYANHMPQELPPFSMDDEGICVWNFSEGPWDWSYAQSLDMTIFRSNDIFPWLQSLDYQSPNQLEHYLVLYAPHGLRGICYQASKIINLPINMVQTYTYNNCVQSYLPEHLLELFNAGLKLDMSHLYQVRNSACHMYDAQILFMPR